jgi:hypothetical protein
VTGYLARFVHMGKRTRHSRVDRFIRKRKRFKFTYRIEILKLPITHKDFTFSMREVTSARISLDSEFPNP